MYSTPDDNEYQYYELVLQWPPAFNVGGGSHRGMNYGYWTIHGLWPSRIKNPESYPCTCTQEEFNIDALTSIMNSMNTYWPSLKNDDYASFWGHEWQKHGTCCTPYLLNQFDYFNTTLALRHKINPGSLPGNMPPSSQKAYSFDEVYGNLRAHGDVVLHCNFDHSTGNQMLFEVMFCMTASKHPNQFACPRKVREASTPKCDPLRPIYILPSAAPAVLVDAEETTIIL